VRQIEDLQVGQTPQLRWQSVQAVVGEVQVQQIRGWHEDGARNIFQLIMAQIQDQERFGSEKIFKIVNKEIVLNFINGMSYQYRTYNTRFFAMRLWALSFPT